MEDARPAKRVRQACDPCRRKKSKCPGERPACSFCQRLDQQCVYSDGENDGNATRQTFRIEQRMEALESKMDNLLDRLAPLATASASQNDPIGQTSPPSSINVLDSSWPSHNVGEPARVTLAQPRGNLHRSSFSTNFAQTAGDDLVLDQTRLQQAGQAYLTWCHSQPLTLFQETTFLSSLGARDSQLKLAIQALGLCFPPGTLTPRKRDHLCDMAQASRRLAMESVFNGRVEISTLQTLCLLSMIDFANGSPTMADVTISMASSLLKGMPRNHTLGDPQEFKDCIHSISMIQNMQGCVSSYAKTPDSANPTSLTMALSPSINLDHLPQSQLDQSILKYGFQLSEVWHMARIYAASVVETDAAPPWNRQSDYSAVTQRHLEIDSHVPMKYRFAANKFSDITPSVLHEQRHYWGPYFFMQLIYATIPCLLNHPFLLSMRLRNFRHTMPQAFIQQSFDLISRHAGWIMYFINMMDKKSLQLSDPALAHCAAIIATIHLQHSFVHDQSLREKSRAGFNQCMKFLDSTSSIWPSIAVMAEKLRKLQKSVVTAPGQGSQDLTNHNGRQSHSIDSKLLWDILIYETAGREDDKTSGHSVFGPSLTRVATSGPGRAAHNTTEVEYDLVGSAGISGHKTVPKESPVYAPEDVATPRDPAMIEPWSFENRFMGGIDEESNYEALFFQPADFGRAVDEWMSFH